MRSSVVSSPFWFAAWALLGLSFASVTTGCGYDCVAECDSVAELLAANGRNPETGLTGGMRATEVCDHPALQRAEDCRQCVDAMVEIYQFFNAEVGCDCPPENPSDEVAAYPVVGFDAECTLQTYAYTEEGCMAFASQPDDLEQCY